MMVMQTANASEMNQQIFLNQLASFLILFFIILVYVIWVNALIFSKVRGKKIWKYIIPLFFLIVLLAVWIFINLLFGINMWGVL